MRKQNRLVLVVSAALTAVVLALPASGEVAQPECLPPLIPCETSQPSDPPPPPPPDPPPSGGGGGDPAIPPPPPPPPAGGGTTNPPPASQPQPQKPSDPAPGSSAQPPPASAPGPSAAPVPGASVPPPPPGASVPPPPGPPQLQVPVFPRTASRTTAGLIQILQPAIDQGAIKPEDLAAHFAPFPVAGLAYFSDDYGFPRYTPTPHLHEGTDIFADEGTPIIAYGPGTLKGIGDQAVGGLSVWVHYDDGNALYYTHLSGFAPGLALGQRVDAGTVLGYVGNSGNAAGGAHHVHLEVHPPIRDSKDRVTAAGTTTLPNGQGSSNTPPKNPKPYLDAWLAQAEERAQALVGGVLQEYAAIPREAHISRRVNELFSLEAVERPGDLLWFSAAQPELGVLGLARQAAGRARLTPAAGSIAQRTAEQQRLAAVRQAVQAPFFGMATLTGMSFYDPMGAPGPS